MFDAAYDGCLFSWGHDSLGFEIALAAKGKTSPDLFSERQMCGSDWDEPKQIEVSKLERLGAMTPIARDDPFCKDMTAVESMWSGRRKRNADGSVKCLGARCCLRGDIQRRTLKMDANQCMSPVVRNSSMMCVDAVSFAFVGSTCVHLT